MWCCVCVLCAFVVFYLRGVMCCGSLFNGQCFRCLDFGVFPFVLFVFAFGVLSLPVRFVCVRCVLFDMFIIYIYIYI